MDISSANATTGNIHFLNLEYFFRLLYDTVFHGGGFATAGWIALLSSIWNFFVLLSIVFAILALVMLIYALMRLYQIEREEAPNYETLSIEHAVSATEYSRWDHVKELIESPHESDWRQAIIEADIMLDEELTHHGLPGESVGEKLKLARFPSVQDAWEAHKVRNDIAHQGMAYHLDDKLAYHTIQKYETVFKDLGAIPRT